MMLHSITLIETYLSAYAFHSVPFIGTYLSAYAFNLVPFIETYYVSICISFEEGCSTPPWF